MRVLADLPEDDLARLDALAARTKRSRASLLREAVRQYLASLSDDRSWIDQGFGLWSEREDIPDGLEYQRAIRDDRTPHDEI